MKLRIVNMIAIIIAPLSFTSCKKNSGTSIIGKWQTPTMQIVEFYEDRTMTITDNGKSIEGRYTLQEESKILLDYGGSSKIETSYMFKDDNTLLMDDGKNKGSMDEFRRIKRQ